jgi:[protein-PII] uridylyltransferase
LSGWDALRGEVDQGLAEIRRGFQQHGDGLRTATARAALVDGLVRRLWAEAVAREPALRSGIAINAVGGYGRGLLFPYSDVDLFFCVERSAAKIAKQPVRRLSQALWDCGIQLSMSMRQPNECERFDAANPEFGLSLLDLRSLGGDGAVFSRLKDKSVGKMRQRDAKLIASELVKLTRERHAKYGGTLFHLEPNIKDCPGGLRDANVCQWLHGLRRGAPVPGPEFDEALAFFAAVRCFLHYRHERDDNTLDWQAQDAAADRGIGLGARSGVDAAYWMRAYFRYARIVERCLAHAAEQFGLRIGPDVPVRRLKLPSNAGFEIKAGRIELAPFAASGIDAAYEPEVVLAAFTAMARSGAALTPASEERIADAIPLLSANLEEGPGLWQQLSAILTGERAAMALRSMHALGVLELILPEFHGIDALVIRDAYHRYTVDEHTFVLIETLHGLEADPGPNAPEWRTKFRSMIRELQNPGLLYLAALMHDTGKGRTGASHAAESAHMARNVLARLEMDAYDSAMVMRLVETHLEMSAALRRDIFDAATVRSFAAKVQTHESLRMLTLFTYADIAAVHPDALTPWKAENLWRLSMAANNQLDRNVDDERVHTRGSLDGTTASRAHDEKIARVLSLSGDHAAEVEHFLEGFPERYVKTRSAEVMLEHFAMTANFAREPFQIAFQYSPAVNEITLVTQDRPRLFAGMASALAAWGMNVVTADAFANSAGVVVDTFRFTDSFRTLELNQSERERFVASVRDLIAGRASVEKLLGGRRRGRRRVPRIVVETRIEFDNAAAVHSTLLQVVAQDSPGLLRAISMTVSSLGYNVEVALVDTEGETAIDVFYLTHGGAQLNAAQQSGLSEALLDAIAANAG